MALVHGIKFLSISGFNIPLVVKGLIPCRFTFKYSRLGKYSTTFDYPHDNLKIHIMNLVLFQGTQL